MHNSWSLGNSYFLRAWGTKTFCFSGIPPSQRLIWFIHGGEVRKSTWALGTTAPSRGSLLKKERGEGEGERKKERRMRGWEGEGGRGSFVVVVENWKQGYGPLTCGGELEGERRRWFEFSAVSDDSASAEDTPLVGRFWREEAGEPLLTTGDERGRVFWIVGSEEIRTKKEEDRRRLKIKPCKAKNFCSSGEQRVTEYAWV